MNHNFNHSGMNYQIGGLLGFCATYLLYYFSSLFVSVTMQNTGAFFTALSGAVVTFVTLYNFFKKKSK